MNGEYKIESLGDLDYQNSKLDSSNLDAILQEDMLLESDNILGGISGANDIELKNSETSDMTLKSDNISETTSDNNEGGFSSEEQSDVSLESDNILAENEENIDYFSDRERATDILSNFTDDNWEQLSLDDKKHVLNQLADYNADVLGIKDKPRIEYYVSDDPSDFGGYSESDNTIYVNEWKLDDPAETADTISHEYRHCYQHERAMNPLTEQDHLFRENFDDYIPASRDFEAYQEQIVESDAREYAQRFKVYINGL